MSQVQVEEVLSRYEGEIGSLRGQNLRQQLSFESAIKELGTEIERLRALVPADQRFPTAEAGQTAPDPVTEALTLVPDPDAAETSSATAAPNRETRRAVQKRAPRPARVKKG